MLMFILATLLQNLYVAAQRMKFSVNDFFSKYEKVRIKLQNY